MNKGEESYEYIGKLALQLRANGETMSLSTLQKRLNELGANYGGGVGMGKVVSAAWRYWESKSIEVHYAIQAAYVGEGGDYLWRD